MDSRICFKAVNLRAVNFKVPLYKVPLKVFSIGLLAVNPCWALTNVGTQLSYTQDIDKSIAIASAAVARIEGSTHTTQTGEIKELILPDGTVLTLSSNTSVTIDRFEYKQVIQQGELVLTLHRGRIKVVGGLINNNQPIIIKSKDSEMSLDNGAALVFIDENGLTRSGLLFGRSLSVISNGAIESIAKPGFWVTSGDSTLSNPSRDSVDMAGAVVALSTERLLLDDLNTGNLTGAGIETDGDKGETGTDSDDEESGQVIAQLDDESDDTSSENSEGSDSPSTSDRNADTNLDNADSPSENPSDSPSDSPVENTVDEPDAVADGGDVNAPEPDNVEDIPDVPDQPVDNPTDEPGVIVDGSDVNTPEPDDVVDVPDQPVDNSVEEPDPVVDGGDTGMPDPDTNPPENTDVPEETEYADLVVPEINQEAGVGDSGSGFGPGGTVDGASLVNEQMTQQNSQLLVLAQVLEEFSFEMDAENLILPSNERNPGRTSNSLFNSTDLFTQAFDVGEDPLSSKVPHDLKDPDVQDEPISYRIFTDGPSNLTISFSAKEFKSDASNYFADAPIIIPFYDSELVDDGSLISGTRETETDEDTGVEGTGYGGPYDERVSFKFLSVGIKKDAAYTNDRVLVHRSADNFLMMEIHPDRSDTTDSFLFATGDIDNRLNTEVFNGSTFSIDQFYLSPGLTGYDQRNTVSTIAANTRGFMREASILDIPDSSFLDSGLLVVNPAGEGGDKQIAVLHADFGIDGLKAAQQSTISVTIGDVNYQVVESSVEAVMEGRTIGSSHSDSSGTVAISSPLRSTSAGAGNPDLKNQAQEQRKGYAGYFVLENYELEPINSGDEALNGGVESTVGGGDLGYAYLRLATATGSQSFNQDQNRRSTTTALTGWASGLSERETGDGVQVRQVDSATSPNLSLQYDHQTNRVEATLGLSNETTITLGGLNGPETKGTSAYVNEDQFAARSSDTSNSALALVSHDVVEGAGAKLGVTQQYEHLKWGFFFGDVVTREGGEREHVHLGTWVAGEAANKAEVSNLPTDRVATYSGHVVGNVYNAGNTYTAVGELTNTWNFGDRRGSFNITNLDSANYAGKTQLIEDSVEFVGVVDEPSDRKVVMHGNFVRSEDDPVAAVQGSIVIQGAEGEAYRVNGTFGAETPKPQ